MKVNTALLMDEAKPVVVNTGPVAAMEPARENEPEHEPVSTEEKPSDKVIDESGIHTKRKVLLLVAAMAGGFVLAVFALTGLVNNARMDNQGYAVNAVTEDDGYVYGDGGTDLLNPETDDIMGSEVSNDADRDGPDEVTALKQELQDTKNKAALLQQEFNVMEDMLDSSLAHEAELQDQLNSLTGN